eukprot:3416565-Amphidinium_carterae.1
MTKRQQRQIQTRRKGARKRHDETNACNTPRSSLQGGKQRQMRSFYYSPLLRCTHAPTPAFVTSLNKHGLAAPAPRRTSVHAVKVNRGDAHRPYHLLPANYNL